MLCICRCKAWNLVPADKRQKSHDTCKSQKVRFVSFAWIKSTSYRVITSRGVIDVSRDVKLDESDPPTCDSRADSSPHVQPDVSVPTSAPAVTAFTTLTPPAMLDAQPATRQAAPPSTRVDPQGITMQPAPTLYTSGVALARVNNSTGSLPHANPLFEEAIEPSPAHETASESHFAPAPVPARNPSILRSSKRSNKCIHPPGPLQSTGAQSKES